MELSTDQPKDARVPRRVAAPTMTQEEPLHVPHLGTTNLDLFPIWSMSKLELRKGNHLAQSCAPNLAERGWDLGFLIVNSVLVLTYYTASPRLESFFPYLASLSFWDDREENG